ncbi:unnamed protein product, partial [marine sediment metagenome]
KNGTTKIEKIPEYKKGFKFKYGLPEDAYENNMYLAPDEKLLIKRFIQYRNAELFFSSLFILCEGDTEKVFLERIFPYHIGKTPGQLGISIISCIGQTYSPFLKVANKDAFNLRWLILSDAETDTREELKSTIINSGYDFTEVEEKIRYLPDGTDFEEYCIDFYGEEINKVIENNFKIKYEKFCNQPDKLSLPKEELINPFIDTIKVGFAEQLALHVIEQKLDIPDIIKNLIDKAMREVEK